MSIWSWLALIAVVAAAGGWWWLRTQRDAEKARARAELDTVQAWEPNATRVLSRGEREAYAVLVRALPEHMVLAQLPLSRFLKVPTRYSYAEWLKRVGSLSADIVICDRSSEVVAVVEVRTGRESGRSLQRLERMERVLTAASIKLATWNENELPSPAEARKQLLGDDAEPLATGTTPFAGGAGAETGDTVRDELLDPPPSTWFDDFDTQPMSNTRTGP